MSTPKQRSMSATVAAHAMHAQGKTNTAPGHAKFMSRFEQQVDPEGKLDERTRAMRAAHARKAYFTNLSLKASQARAKRKVSTGTESTDFNPPQAGSPSLGAGGVSASRATEGSATFPVSGPAGSNREGEG